MKNSRNNYPIFRFREFPVYKDSLEFATVIKSYSRKYFPKFERYCLTSQLWRALDSIILNIAEGTDKYSLTDFSRFLNQALGSLNEVVACLDIAYREGYISLDKHQEFIQKADNLYRQLKAFSSYIRKKGKNL